MKKAVFVSNSKYIVDLFWHPEYADYAKSKGIRIDIPAINGDLKDFDWQAILPEYDAAITAWSSPLLNAEFLRTADKLKILGHAAGSVGSVSDASTYEKGVTVTCCNKLMAKGVASYGSFMTLWAMRQLWNYAKFENRPLTWNNRGMMKIPGKTVVGIWGLGDISRYLLETLRTLGLKQILVYSGHASSEELEKLGAMKAESMEQLFAESDIIHLLAGASGDNIGRVDKKLLELVQDGATLMNYGRARLIDQQSLYDELPKQRFNFIADVYYQEPLAADDPLNTLPNVICTPHNAGVPDQDTYIKFIIEEFERFFKGEPLLGEIAGSRRNTMTNERLWRK